MTTWAPDGLDVILSSGGTTAAVSAAGFVASADLVASPAFSPSAGFSLSAILPASVGFSLSAVLAASAGFSLSAVFSLSAGLSLSAVLVASPPVFIFSPAASSGFVADLDPSVAAVVRSCLRERLDFAVDWP